MTSPSQVANERKLLDQVLKPASKLDRRRFFVSAAAFGAAAAGAGAAQAQVAAAATTQIPSLTPPDTLHHSMRKAAGRSRQTFVKDLSQLVDLNGTNQGAAYWNFKSYITPIDQFFIRNEFSTPRQDLDSRVARETWQLTIHGDAVEQPLTLTYADLMKLPSRSLIATMECAGNGRSLFWEQQGMLDDPTKVGGTGWGLGGIGQAEWQYVPMSVILAKVGLKKNAKAALFWSGVDNKEDKPGAIGDRGRPIDIATLTSNADFIGLAFKMNGQDLPADHGGPVRMVVPGYCGAASIKWVTEIKIASHDFWVPLNTTAHVLVGPDYAPSKPAPGDEFRFTTTDKIKGQPVLWSPPKSLITVPLVLEKQPKIPHNYPLKAGEMPKIPAGLQMINGYAWAPRYGVRHVEYRLNGGQWKRATILPPNLGRFSWVRFEFPFNPLAGRHEIETRTTDMRGNKQPATVPFNKGGFDFWAIPKFKVEAV